MIPKGSIELKELYDRILYVSADERYDITVFNEIPWYLRGEILEHNEVIYADDLIDRLQTSLKKKHS